MHVQSCGMNMHTHMYKCVCVRACVCVRVHASDHERRVSLFSHTDGECCRRRHRAQKNTYIPVFGCGLGSNRRANVTQPWLQIATFAYPKKRAFTGRCPM